MTGVMGKQGPWGAIAVVLGGVLMAAGPPPLELWPLAWVALIPLWWQVVYGPGADRPRDAPSFPPSGPSLGRAFRLGLWWSLAYHGLVLWWMTHLHPLTWMGVPWVASVAIAAFAWGFITLWGGVTFGVWALGMAWVRRHWPQAPWVQLLTGTALWCALETLLSWGPLFWPPLALTQSPGNSWILHLGQGSGPITITAAIVAVNGALTLALARLHQGQRPWGLGLGILGLWLGLQGIGGAIALTAAPDAPHQALVLGLVQGNIPTRIKLTPAGIRRATLAYAQGYRNLVDQGAVGVVTPEGALPEVWRDRPQSENPIAEAVRERGVPLWLGTFRPVATATGYALTQSLATLDGTAQVISQYDKVKLVPLGEYIPFERVLGAVISRLSPVEGSLAPGPPPQGLDTPLGKAIVGICYESAYSELFRRQAAQGGQWIMTASNNDPYPRAMMIQHHAQDVMRAIESDRWALRVTNTGLSGVVTPRGETLWLSEPLVYTTHLATVYRRDTRTPYVRWGDWLTPLLLTASAITLGWQRLSPRPPRP